MSITKEKALQLYEKMCTIREFEELVKKNTWQATCQASFICISEKKLWLLVSVAHWKNVII